MATVPAPITFVASNVLSAAQLNTNVRDAVNFLIAPPAAVLRNSAAQSLTTATWTPLTWDTEDLDSDNAHSTVTNTARYTAVTAGWYLVTGNVEFVANATGIRQARITDGTTVFGGQNAVSASAGGTTTLSVSAMVFLAAAAFVQFEAYQTSGGALNTMVQGLVGASNGDTKMSVLWVHS